MLMPTLSPAEMQLLLSRAGLVLNPGQIADLVLAWRQVAGLIASIPHDRPLVDDLAYAFRLPPPPGASAAVPAKPPGKAKRATPRSRQPAKVKKAAPKRPARKAAVKRASRRR